MNFWAMGLLRKSLESKGKEAAKRMLTVKQLFQADGLGLNAN